MTKRTMPVLLILVMMITTACWDMMDIEERLYVSGVAFDAPDPAQVERQRAALEEADIFTPGYLISYVCPVPSVQIGKGEGEFFFTKSITSVTPDEAERQISNRIDKNPFFGHVKLTLFGEEILKDEHKVKEILDYLHRNQEYNWNVLVGVVEGRAKDAFSIQPKGITNLVSYITGIMENRPVSSRVSDVTLNQFINDGGKDGTLALPRVMVASDEVKVEGAAVLKDFHFLGYLSGIEGRSLMFLKGTIEGGSVVVNFKDIFIPYQVINATVKKDLKTTGEGLQLTYAIESEGQLNELIHGKNIATAENIKVIESQVEKEIVKDCMKAIDKLQNDFKCDLIYADDYIRKYHPRVWKEFEKDWDKYFSQLNIRVTVDVKIRRIGVAK